MLRFVPSDSGWKVAVRCDIQNHELPKDLEGHDILCHLKLEERLFVNDMTKYYMLSRYIVCTLKDGDHDNLTSIVQIYKETSTYHTSKRGSLTKMQHLLKLINGKKYMY